MLPASLEARLRSALIEDQAFFDITTRAIPHAGRQPGRAVVVARERGVFCGAFLARSLFRLLDRSVRAVTKVRDGQSVRPGQVLIDIRGRLAALLAGERTYLNLAGHLSGVASLTARFVSAVSGTKASILDTRKTTPLWRDLERFAVRCGGGTNHRFSLGDAVLVKDNHLAWLDKRGLSAERIYGRLPTSLKRRAAFVEIEAKTLGQVWHAIAAGADIILLDNMPPARLSSAIELIRAARRAKGSAAPLIEVSGGADLARARRWARLGVDRISVGALTHSAPNLDLSMEVV